MSALPTLAAVLASHTDIATVPAPGFPAWVSDGTQFLTPITVTAVLDRVAVVHPFGHDDERRALRLDAVFVAPQSIRWQPRNRHELKELESRQRVRANRRGKDPGPSAVRVVTSRDSIFHADRQSDAGRMRFTFPVSNLRFTGDPTDRYAAQDSEAAAREQRKRDWPNPVKRAAHLRADAARVRAMVSDRMSFAERKRRSDAIKARARRPPKWA